MKVIVQKYGGSSLATPTLINRIAQRVIKTKQLGYDVVVVASALGDTTDHLLNLSKQITKHPPGRELDMLLSTGENISIALLAMAIQENGCPAISLTANQVGIITNNNHTRARILEIKKERIKKELSHGKIVVIAGYQGICGENEITTLGRGGSDTTAVALAATLKAERCEIMSDVDGVYTANPRFVSNARRLERISYDEMLDMAELGSQVLKTTAVEFAKNHDVTIHVGSSFSELIGTIVTNGSWHDPRVTGVVFDENIVLVCLKNSSKVTNFAISSLLAREFVHVKFIYDMDQQCCLVLKNDDLESAKRLIDAQIGQLKDVTYTVNHDLGLLSIVGIGISFASEVITKALQVFDEMQILPQTYYFSETRLSFAIDKQQLSLAVSRIHDVLILRKN